VFTLPNLENFNSKNVKKKKLFTLGPTMQAYNKEDENLVNLSKCPQCHVRPNVSKHLQRSPKNRKFMNLSIMLPFQKSCSKSNGIHTHTHTHEFASNAFGLK
jgi:hypothetical protein